MNIYNFYPAAPAKQVAVRYVVQSELMVLLQIFRSSHCPFSPPQDDTARLANHTPPPNYPSERYPVYDIPIDPVLLEYDRVEREK